ncbi:hypothetical protein [Defluviitalea phaphyphila]|uniref:hypothetical protein n=1 Tax=Defluviitalea phaphyphila TaxID=1473580 RepID=UPI00072FE495|nr:hypothetical protein [Defluviitalea phaphyphila]
MEKDTSINEITDIITDKNYIRNDIVEITNIIKNILNDKYILKINELISQHKAKTINNPTKEIMLMQAVKPFMNKKAQINIDKMIELMNIMGTAKSIQKDLQQVIVQKNYEQQK